MTPFQRLFCKSGKSSVIGSVNFVGVVGPR
jgi:hypothetical protein